MANEKTRGGMKGGQEKQRIGKKHQGVRPGTTATAKERADKEKRQKVVPSR